MYILLKVGELEAKVSDLEVDGLLVEHLQQCVDTLEAQLEATSSSAKQIQLSEATAKVAAAEAEIAELQSENSALQSELSATVDESEHALKAVQTAKKRVKADLRAVQAQRDQLAVQNSTAHALLLGVADHVESVRIFVLSVISQTICFPNSLLLFGRFHSMGSQTSSYSC